METICTLEGGFPWGFRLEGDGTQDDPVRISKIINKSKADNAGLRSGDVLLSVNRQPLSGLNSNEVMRIIREAETTLNLGLRKASSNGGLSILSNSSSSFSPVQHFDSVKDSDNKNLRTSNHQIKRLHENETNTHVANGINSQDSSNRSKQALYDLNHNRHMENSEVRKDLENDRNRIKTSNNIHNNHCQNTTIDRTLYRTPESHSFASNINSSNILNGSFAALKSVEESDAMLRNSASGCGGEEVSHILDNANSTAHRDSCETDVNNSSNNDASHLPKIQMPTITLLKMTRGRDSSAANSQSETTPQNFGFSNSAKESLNSTQNGSRTRDAGAHGRITDKTVSHNSVSSIPKPNPSLTSPITSKTKAQMTADWVLHGSETSRSIESDLSLIGNSENTSSILPKDDSGYSDCDQAPLASPPEASSESSTPRIAMPPSNGSVLQELLSSSSKKAGGRPSRNGNELRRSYSTPNDNRFESVAKRVQIEGDRRLIIYDGIGPTDAETGVPMAPRHSVEPKNQKEWYKCMYKSMHVLRRSSGEEDYPFSALQKSLDDSKARFEPSRIQSKGKSAEENYRIRRATSSELFSPSKKDQPSTFSSRKNSTSTPVTNELRSPTNSHKESWKPPDAKYEAMIYRNQPNDVQDYIPGVRSSLTSPRMTSSSVCSSPLNESLDCNDIKRSAFLQPNSGVSRRESTKSFSSQQTLSPRGHRRTPSNGSNISGFSQTNVNCTSPRPSSGWYNQAYMGVPNGQHQFINSNGLPQDPPNGQRSNISHSARKALALYCYKATNECEISFEKGETIYIYKKLDRTWYEGECNGQIGKFPASYVKILPAESPNGHSDQNGRESRMSSVSVDVRESLGQVIHDFMAESSRELSLRIGDIVTITKKLDKNWYEGTNGNRRGIFPLQCITVLPESAYQNGHSRSRNESFTSTDTFEDPFQSSRTNARWEPDFRHPATSSETPTTYPHNYDGGRGQYSRTILSNRGNSFTNINLIPGGYETDSSQPVTRNNVENFQNGNATQRYAPTTNASDAREVCRVVYSYKPHNEDELELMEGDLVQVLQKFDDGWFLGESRRTGRRGTFPSNYVHIIR